jgi:peroxiredoxin
VTAGRAAGRERAPARGADAPHAPDAPAAHKDRFPDPGAHPTVESVRDGRWTDPATWSTGRVPAPGDRVRVSGGTAVVFDAADARVVCVSVDGTLTFATATDTRLSLQDLRVNANGELDLGTRADPISPSVTATVTFLNRPFDLEADPEQSGHGLVAFGTVRVYGAPKTSFLRLEREARAGDTAVALEAAPAGWRPGDRLILPDSRPIHGERFAKYGEAQRAGVAPDMGWEELTVAGVSGNVVTLTRPLAFDHPGAHDPDGKLSEVTLVSDRRRVKLLPHLGNLGRNVVFRSEDPSGVRGHVLFAHRADVKVFYALFKDLGRTTVRPLDSTARDPDGTLAHVGANQIGRYAFHFHHVIGPKSPDPTGFQFQAVGNAVDGSPKWGIVVHDSFFGLVQDNVVYNARGACVVTETGAEAFNVIAHNFMVRSEGSGELSHARRTNEGAKDNGFEGSGLWTRGNLKNLIADNVVANTRQNGYNLFQFGPTDSWVPRTRGADPAVHGTKVDLTRAMFEPAIQAVRVRNEAYGVYGFHGQASEHWGTLLPTGFEETDLIYWNNFRMGFGGGSGNQQNWHLIHPVIRFAYDPAKRGNLPDWFRYAVALDTNPSYVHYVKVEGADIQGAAVAVPENTFYGDLVIKDGYFRNHENIVLYPIPHTVVLANNRFDPVPGVPLRTIRYDHAPYKGDTRLDGDLTKPQPPAVLPVYDHDGVRGANYLLYSPQQDPRAVVPPDQGDRFKGAPASGITNERAWAEYGIAMGWQVAPLREHDDPDGSKARALARGLGAAPGMLAFPLPAPTPDLDGKAPRLLVNSPVPGASYSFKEVPVRFTRLGKQDRTYAAVFGVDRRPDLVFKSSDFWGDQVVMKGVPDGRHVLRWHLLDPGGKMVPGSEGSLRFTTFTPAAPKNLRRVASPAPPLRLPDPGGRLWSLDGFKGRTVVLVFFQGAECAHCVGQLRDLVRDARGRVGPTTELVAVSGRRVESAREALALLGVQAPDRFHLLVDEDHRAFRDFGCYDGGPLHGLFLIDRQGVIRARYAGELPYDDVREVVRRVRSLTPSVGRIRS